MMTERDLRSFKRMGVFLPVLTIVATLLIQLGYWQANSANLDKRIEDQKTIYDKRFERIEKEKADKFVIEEKINNINWKLDLILKNLGISYTSPVQKKELTWPE